MEISFLILSLGSDVASLNLGVYGTLSCDVWWKIKRDIVCDVLSVCLTHRKLTVTAVAAAATAAVLINADGRLEASVHPIPSQWLMLRIIREFNVAV